MSKDSLINEIYENEKAYVENLKILRESYEKPLYNDDLIPIKKVFGNLKEIVTVNQKLISKLERLVENKKGSISNIFVQFISFIDDYNDYIKNFDNAIKLVDKYFQEEEDFKKAITRIEKEETHFTLKEGLALPLQRIITYANNIEKLFGVCEEDEKEELKEAQKEMKETLKLALQFAPSKNTNNTNTNSSTKINGELLKLSNSLLYKPKDENSKIDFSAEGLELVLEGQLLVIPDGGLDKEDDTTGWKSRKIYLFNQMLLLTIFSGGDSIMYDDVLYFKTVPIPWVKDLNYENCFQVVGKAKTINLQANDAKEKAKWIDAIEEVIEKLVNDKKNKMKGEDKAKPTYEPKLKSNTKKVSIKDSDEEDDEEIERRLREEEERRLELEEEIRKLDEQNRLLEEEQRRLEEEGGGVEEINDEEDENAYTTGDKELDIITALEKFQQGNEHFIKKEFKEAVFYYTEATKYDNSLTSAFYNRGIMYFNMNDFKNAIEDFTIVIKREPEHSKAITLRGTCYKSLGKFQDAVEDFKRTIELDPNLKNAYMSLAVCYDRLDKEEEAINNYTEFLSLDSKSANSVTAYHNRAQNYYVLGKIEEAVKDYTAAIDICNDNNFKKELYSLRAKCYAKLKKTDLAQKDLQKAGDESDNKDAAEAAKHMASQFYNDKQYDKAIECFTKCLKHEPNNYLIYYNRAMCYKQLKKNEDAISDFEKCIELNNDYIMAHIMLGRVYTSKNQIEKAIKSYTNSLKIKDNSAIYFDRGCLYNQLQDYDKAIKDFTKCCDIDNTNTDSFYNRGSIYHRQFKEYDLALKDYNKVLSINSKDIDVLLDRAMLHYQMENDEKAKDDFEKIFKLDPNHERAKQIYDRMFGDN